MEEPKKERTKAQKDWDQKLGQLKRKGKSKKHKYYYFGAVAVLLVGLTAYAIFRRISPQNIPKQKTATINEINTIKLNASAATDVSRHTPVENNRRRPILQME